MPIDNKNERMIEFYRTVMQIDEERGETTNHTTDELKAYTNEEIRNTVKK